MSIDKAERLAAIRAANAASAAAPADVTADPAARPTFRERAQRWEQSHALPQRRELAPITAAHLLLAASALIICGVLIVAELVIAEPMRAAAFVAIGNETWHTLSRASAFVAFLLLWGAMVLGLSTTSKLAKVWPGGPAVVDIHRHISLLSLALMVLHVLVLLGDSALGYTFANALLPFSGSAYRQFWIGLLGKLSLYMMIIVVFSFSLRTRIGARVWRALHYLSFAVFGMGLVHGLFAGSDSQASWARALYAVCALSVVGMTIYRIVVSRRKSSGAAVPKRAAERQQPVQG